MAKVSGNRPADTYIQQGLQQFKGAASAFANGGTEGIGDYLNGQMTAMGENAFNNSMQQLGDAMFGENSTGSMIFSAVMDVGKTVAKVLAGQDVGKDEIKESSTNASDVKGKTDTMQNQGEVTQKAAEDVKQEATDDATTKKVEIDEKGNEVTVLVTESQDVITEKKEENRSKQEEIENNKKEIEQKQQRKQELEDKIKDLKTKYEVKDNPKQKAVKPQNYWAEQAKNAPPKFEPPKFGAQTDNPTGTQPQCAQPADEQAGEGQTEFEPINTTGFAEIDAAIKEYNDLGVDIAGLNVLNQSMSEDIVANDEEIASVVDETISVSDEQMASIDELTNEIVSTMESAEGAIKELQSILQGQFKTLDKATCITLAKEMTKAALNGTQSGVLAAAASAMGVSSIFSFGSTAEKAANLGKNAAECGVAGGKEIAANVTGKIMEKAKESFVKQVVGNLTQGLGDLAGLDASMMSEIQGLTNTLTNDLLASFKADNGVSDDEDSGGDDKKSEEKKKPAAEPKTPQTNMA